MDRGYWLHIYVYVYCVPIYYLSKLLGCFVCLWGNRVTRVILVNGSYTSFSGITAAITIWRKKGLSVGANPLFDAFLWYLIQILIVLDISTLYIQDSVQRTSRQQSTS